LALPHDTGQPYEEELGTGLGTAPAGLESADSTNLLPQYQ